MKAFTTPIIVTVIIGLIGFGSYAFAGWHGSYGSHMREGGYGMGAGWRGNDYNNLTSEEKEKIDEVRQAYFSSIDDIREQLYDKHADFKDELSQETPDKEKLLALQKEITELRGQIDSQRIDYMLQLKEINPEFGTGFTARGPKGFGRGRFGGGPCW